MKHFGSYSTPFLFKQPEEVAHNSMLLKTYSGNITSLWIKHSYESAFESCTHSTLCGNTHTDTHDACVLPYLEEQGSIHGRHVVIADEDDLIR